MGYVNSDLGDYIAKQGGATVSDAFYNRLPSGLRSLYIKKTPTVVPAPTIKIQVAAPTPVPSTNPIVKLAQSLINTAVPPRQVPTDAPVTGATAQTIQNVAPIVAATAGAAGLGPIAATIPALVDTATAPPSVQVRIVPDASVPNVSTTAAPLPSTSGGSAEIYNADGTPVNQAAVTASSGTDILASLKSLPPVALVALAGGALFLLSRRGR